MLLLVMTFASFPFLYASLELPKMIINQAIGATGFPRVVYGVSLEQVEYLMILCGIFLLLVAANGGFKYVINVFKGQLGERMLRRLRYQLFGQALRFPVPHFRRTSQGELVAMITSEVEPLGGFIGDAYAQPAFQGGTLLTILAFMFAQDMVLGMAAIALYPLQMWLIPKLQRQVNQLAKQRVRTVRRLAERIGEAVTSIEEIHANDTSEWHRADFASWVGRIYEIRLKIYRKKFFIKFLNNFLAQLTPFFFYSIGGYLVIRGELSFGALVAVLSAYKDLSSPWKEMLDWYQQKEDTRVKYDQLIEQFRPPGMLPEDLQTASDGPVPRLSGLVVASGLTLEDEAGVRAVDAASFRFESYQHVALLGGAGSGSEQVAKLLACLLRPTNGALAIGETNFATMPEWIGGRRLAYVGAHVPLINGTIRDNLVYPLQHQPLRPAALHSEEERESRRRYVFEAERSGNTISHPDDDWIDYEAAGVEDAEGLRARTVELLDLVELGPDLLALGLRGTVDPQTRGELAARVLEARRAFRERLADAAASSGEGQGASTLVETFDRNRYNSNMSVAENLLFGLPIGDSFDLDNLGDHSYVQQVLEQTGLREDFFETGFQVAKIMVDLLSDLEPGHDFFDRFSFISSDDLPMYQAAIRRVESAGIRAADQADRNLLSSLPFRLIPARHRLGLIDEAMTRRLVQARHAFADGLPEELRYSVAFFDPDAYNPVASVQDNILFGKLVYGRQQAQREIGALMSEVLEELDLRREIVGLGVDFDVGIGGSRLSPGQRQKLGIARALIKRPDLLILDHATAGLDAAARETILGKLLQLSTDAGLVWVTGDVDDVRQFDVVIMMDGGRVSELGPPDQVLGVLDGEPMVAAN